MNDDENVLGRTGWMTLHRKRRTAGAPRRGRLAVPASGRLAVPASMQALLRERDREATEPPDGRREGMPAALQARDNLRRRLGAG